MSRQELYKAVALEFSFSRRFHRALATGVVAFLGLLTMAMAVEVPKINPQSNVLPDALEHMLRNAEAVLQHFDELRWTLRREDVRLAGPRLHDDDV